jgi:hypothetical protein
MEELLRALYTLVDGMRDLTRRMGVLLPCEYAAEDVADAYSPLVSTSSGGAVMDGLGFVLRALPGVAREAEEVDRTRVGALVISSCQRVAGEEERGCGHAGHNSRLSRDSACCIRTPEELFAGTLSCSNWWRRERG